MGLFGSKKKKKERKEAYATLKHLEIGRTATKRAATKMASSAVDPSRAITELQPWQVGQENSKKALSTFTHKDIYGREIAEPDLTNPTRSRWERPLETIRAFQDSIDKGYRDAPFADPPQVSGPPSRASRGSFARPDYTRSEPKNDYNRNGGGGYSEQNVYPMPPNRMGGSATPLSNSSGESHYNNGMAAGRHDMNDGMVAGNPIMSNRPRNYSGASGYPDTGYGGSVEQGSRGNSSGNLEYDLSWTNPGGATNGGSNGAAYPSGPSQGGPAYPSGYSSGYPPATNGHGAPPNSGPLQPQGLSQVNRVPRNHSPLQQAPHVPAKDTTRGSIIKLASVAPAPPSPQPSVKHKSWLSRRFSKT